MTLASSQTFEHVTGHCCNHMHMYDNNCIVCVCVCVGEVGVIKVSYHA